MEQTIYAGFAARLREQRAKQSMSQQELAGSAGLTRSAVANMESGRQGILLHHIYALARALGCEPAALLPPAPAEEVKPWIGAPRKVELFVASLSARQSKASPS